MRGAWFGLCLLTAAAVVLYTLVFGGPVATVILLALILLTLAEPSSQPAARAAGRAESPPAAPYYCDRCNASVPADAKFCPQCGDRFQD